MYILVCRTSVRLLRFSWVVLSILKPFQWNDRLGNNENPSFCWVVTTKTFLQILRLVGQQQKPFLSFGRATTKTLPLDPKIITQMCGCALSVRVVLFCILTHLGLFCFPLDGL